MTTLVLETEPTALAVTIVDDRLTVELADGRSILVPLAWYPKKYRIKFNDEQIKLLKKHFEIMDISVLKHLIGTELEERFPEIAEGAVNGHNKKFNNYA